MRETSPLTPMLPRREFLWHFGGGLGGIALAQLLGQNGLLADNTPADARTHVHGGLHHPAKVKRVVQLFMNGGASQCDTFDYKPALIKRSGEKFDFGLTATATGVPGHLMKCPWDWKQHGQCGRWVSGIFPNMASCVDDMAFLMAMASKTNVHGPGVYMQNSGFTIPGFPCLGAWISYGLGSLNENLPAFVVLPDARGLPYNSKGSFSSGFLPVKHQGLIIRPAAANPIADLRPAPSAKFVTQASEDEGLALLHKMNQEHSERWAGDSRLEARIASYELAARMQLSAPEALGLGGESEETRRFYGLDHEVTRDFGRNCLIARRLLERGVRFVQVWSGTAGASGNWDNHGDIERELSFIAQRTDQPVAALVKDLKARGLLDDTLVVWTTEFGRMPFSQGSKGRDHNGGTFAMWLAGAGIRGGAAYGESDEFSFQAEVNRTYCYDLHATILHLLGIDHERLTFRHNGSDRRLTDVHGHVIHEILS